MSEIIDWIKNHKKDTVYILIIIVIIAICFFLHQAKNKAKTQTVESQAQAETSQGVDDAAKDAKIQLQQDQLNEAAKQIAALNDQEPEKVVQTVVKEVPATVEKERQSSGADFAVVTDPENTDQTVDLSTLPSDEAVTLNQYNVYAYKKILHTVSYAPKTLKNWQPKQIGASVAKKITDSGQYIGAGIDYNFDDDRAIVKLEYTW